jgi:hypothetical protein
MAGDLGSVGLPAAKQDFPANRGDRIYAPYGLASMDDTVLAALVEQVLAGDELIRWCSRANKKTADGRHPRKSGTRRRRSSPPRRVRRVKRPSLAALEDASRGKLRQSRPDAATLRRSELV